MFYSLASVHLLLSISYPFSSSQLPHLESSTQAPESAPERSPTTMSFRGIPPISISISGSCPRCLLVLLEAMSSVSSYHYLLSRVTHFLTSVPLPRPPLPLSTHSMTTPLLQFHSSNPSHSGASLVHWEDVYQTLFITFVVPILVCDTIHSLSYNLSSSVFISYFKFFGPKILCCIS